MSTSDESSEELAAAATHIDDTLSYMDAVTGSTDKEPALRRGAVVGRYVVLGKIGEGGMGAVYGAYDPDLDRKIALKFLHSQVTGHDSQGGEQARLLREAQAMAKLSHPNVAAVYDVGTYHGMVFIAMEFIAGLTLKQWLAKKERAWWEIWTVLEGAGRGLAAAHRAKIIHRDFKPDNILVDDQRRARVTDFGLARPTAKPDSVDDDELADSSGPLHETLTATGTIMGTPRYMAPEQHLGKETTARTDQFAFCLVVFEAIYGERAFKGDSLGELRAAVTDGELVQPKGNRGDAPAWRHQALERGLSVEPAKRYPSMGELLTALDRNPRGRRNRLAAATVSIAAVVGVAAMLWPETRRSPVALCSASAQVMEQTWNDDARKKLATSFAATKSHIAADTAKRVTSLLDNYAASWTEMHEDSCKATNVRGDQSAEMLDLRAECLDQRRIEMNALISRLTDKPNEKAVRKATKAAAFLVSVRGCADRTTLRTVAPLPDDPAKRARIKQLQGDRAKMRSSRNTGDRKGWEAGIELLRKALPTVDYPQLAAEIQQSIAWMAVHNSKYKEAIARYQKAAVLAAEARDDQRAAIVWTRLAWLIGMTRNPQQGLELMNVAEALWKRARGDVKFVADMHQDKGAILKNAAKFKEARAEYDKALALLQEKAPNNKLALSVVHTDLAQLAFRTGNMGESRKHARLSRQLTIAALGPDHPQIGSTLVTLGAQELRAGNYAEAISVFKAALAAKTKQFGAGAAMLLNVKSWIAQATYKSGDKAGAKKLFAPLVKQARTLDLAHPMVGNLFNEAASAYQGPEARDLTKLAVKAATKRHGATHPQTAQAMVGLGEACLRVKDWQCAVDNTRKAIPILAKTVPATNIVHVPPLYYLGNALLGQGKANEAVPVLEKAVAACVRAKANAYRFTVNRLSLAKALIQANPRKNRARAIKVARQAHADALRIKGAHKKTQAALAEAFLKKNGATVK